MRERSDDPLPLPRADRLARRRDIIARLHLDRGKNLPAAKDEVDLANRRAISPGEKPITFEA